jgi:hypothetical protein
VPRRRLRALHHLPTLRKEHCKRIRHSNFIERMFGETRRQVKVIGRLPGRAELPVTRVGGARSRVAGDGVELPQRSCAGSTTCGASSSNCPVSLAKRRWWTRLLQPPRRIESGCTVNRLCTFSGTPPINGTKMRSEQFMSRLNAPFDRLISHPARASNSTSRQLSSSPNGGRFRLGTRRRISGLH